MPALTPEQEMLKQAALAATGGPWLHRHDPGNPVGVQHGVKLGGEFGSWVCDCLDNADQRTDGGVAGDRNAQFIAAANPGAILALLAQIEATRDWIVLCGCMQVDLTYVPQKLEWDGDADAPSGPAPSATSETSLQFLADQAQELGMGYGVTLSDGEVIQIGDPKISRRATDLRAQLAAPAQSASTCRQCHADRLKEPCRAEDWEPCGMVWVALPGEPAQ